MKFEIIQSDNEEKDFNEFLRAQLREYNNRISQPHLQSRQPGAVVPINLILKDSSGVILGGLWGETYWNWLEIEKFYIPEELRGSGIGSQMLHSAEVIGIQRGCQHCFLTTFEFQARRFYEKRGYRISGTLHDFPPGSAYYWMVKDLN